MSIKSFRFMLKFFIIFIMNEIKCLKEAAEEMYTAALIMLLMMMEIYR